MLCPYCNKNHINAIINIFDGKEHIVKKACNECALRMLKEMQEKYGIEPKFSETIQEKIESKTPLELHFCRRCGTALSQLNPDSVLGCPECYRCLLALNKMQPAKTEENEDGEETLENALKIAILEEDYSEAKRISERLKEMKSRNYE